MTDPEFLALITSLRQRMPYSIDVMKLCDEASLMRGHQARFSEAWQQLRERLREPPAGFEWVPRVDWCDELDSFTATMVAIERKV
ncbi:MAG: hypothetical protein ACYS7M_11035 [Planctomycetota bacterium]|jgi:hypothetical protein